MLDMVPDFMEENLPKDNVSQERDMNWPPLQAQKDSVYTELDVGQGRLCEPP